MKKIDKIVSVIGYPSPQCVIKCIVNTMYPFDKSKKESQLKNAFSYYSFNNSSGLYIALDYGIVLEKTEKTVSTQNGVDTAMKNRCTIKLPDVFSVSNMLNTVYNWLLHPQDIFQKDQYGVVMGIKNKRARVQVNLDWGYIAFKPCVIQDTAGMMYEGVGFGNQNGEIANFTGIEFATFRLLMQYILPNMYQIALETYQAAQLYQLSLFKQGG